MRILYLLSNPELMKFVSEFNDQAYDLSRKELIEEIKNNRIITLEFETYGGLDVHVKHIQN